MNGHGMRRRVFGFSFSCFSRDETRREDWQCANCQLWKGKEPLLGRTGRFNGRDLADKPSPLVDAPGKQGSRAHDDLCQIEVISLVLRLVPAPRSQRAVHQIYSMLPTLPTLPIPL